MMSRPYPRLTALSGAVCLAALTAAFMLPGGRQVTAASQGPCGLTTLDGTIKPAEDGTLECAPGQALVVRDDLAAPKTERVQTRDPLLAFLSLADFQLADEESPLRGEWTDKCGAHPATSAFRPHETLVPHLLNAHVKAANAIASNLTGSPSLRTQYSFAVQLGDAADNQQYNEVRAFIDLLDGGKVVDPDSGADGYEGVQGRDPQGGEEALNGAPADISLLDLANEPFWATGLRNWNGGPIPWYSVMGNHDVKVQGTLPDDNEGWRTFARAWVLGQLKVQDLAPDHLQRVCADPTVLTDPTFWQQVALQPGTTRLVAADADRKLLDREQWIEEHNDTTGLPVGHGFGAGRCTDEDGNKLTRGCYSWNQEPFHFVVLDTTPAEGLQQGLIDEEQFAWLERDLVATSSTYYDANGEKETHAVEDRLTVVFAHHTISTTNNDIARQQTNGHDGAALAALLLRFPNVVLQANGHTHANRVWAHEDDAKGTGFWEINTSAVADWPSQSRSIEIADNHDGTLSIFGVLFDAAVAPDPRAIEWDDDPTDETSNDLGDLARAVNEDWLASVGREVGYNDPQVQLGDGIIGTPEDRNVELVLKHPWGVTTSTSKVVPGPNVGSGFTPPPSFPGLTPGLGFPGNFPTTFPQFPTLPTNPPFPQAPQPQFPTTQRGIGAPEPASTGVGLRAGLMLLAAASGGYWLIQARVRRYMVGI